MSQYNNHEDPVSSFGADFMKFLIGNEESPKKQKKVPPPVPPKPTKRSGSRIPKNVYSPPDFRPNNNEERLTVENSKLKNDLDIKTQECLKLKTKLEEVKNRLGGISKKSNSWVSDLIQAKSQLQPIPSQEFARIQQEYKKANLDLQVIRKQHHDLSLKYNELLEQSKSPVDSKNAEPDFEVESMKATILSLNDEIERYKVHVEESTKELAEVQKKLSNQSQDTVQNAIINDLQRELSEYQQHHNVLLKKFEIEKDNFQKELAKHAQVNDNDKLAEAEHNLAEAEHSINELLQQNENLFRQNNDLIQQLSDISELESRYNSLETNHQQLNDELTYSHQRYNEDVTELERKLMDLEDQHLKHLESIEPLKQELTSYKEADKRAGTRYMELSQQYQDVSDQYEMAYQEIIKSERQQQQLAQHIKQLEDEVKQRDETIQFMSAERNELTQQHEQELTRSQKTILTEQKDMSSYIKKLEKDNQLLKGNYDAETAKTFKLMKKIDEMKTNFKQHETNMKQQEKKYAKLNHKLGETKANLRQQENKYFKLENKVKELETNKTYYDQLSQQQEGLISQFQQLEEENVQLKTTVTQQVEEESKSTARINKLEYLVDKLQNINNEKSNELTQLMQELSDYKQENVKLTSTIQEMKPAYEEAQKVYSTWTLIDETDIEVEKKEGETL